MSRKEMLITKLVILFAISALFFFGVYFMYFAISESIFASFTDAQMEVVYAAFLGPFLALAGINCLWMYIPLIQKK